MEVALEMAVLAWLVLGIVLLAVELHHWAFYALFGALGALAAVVVALASPDAVMAQAGTFGLVAAAGVVGVRPLMSGFIARHHGGLVARGVHGGIVGQEVITLDEVGDIHHAGHALLAGERWLATCEGNEPIAPHTPAIVTAVSGTTLVLLPRAAIDPT